MPDSLITVLTQSFNAVNSTIGLLIAVFAAITMRRYGNIIYFSALSLIVDQFVGIAFKRQWDSSVENVSSQIWDEILSLDASVLVIRFIGFMLVITIVFSVKRLFRRD